MNEIIYYEMIDKYHVVFTLRDLETASCLIFFSPYDVLCLISRNLSKDSSLKKSLLYFSIVFCELNFFL